LGLHTVVNFRGFKCTVFQSVFFGGVGLNPH
jgi:hypothetical protein